MSQVYELNLDGLVGPTHHYAGLSQGNLASTRNALSTANPQAAALQGLAKMRLLHELGIPQAVLPPHQRPNLDLLTRLGFSGSAVQQINKAKRDAPALLSAAYSASSMWAANMATVSASIDTADHKLHFTAANLINLLHRHQEADFSSKVLKTLFSDPDLFQHHPLLPNSMITADEGAANHNRLCGQHSQTALYLFVYGKETLNHQSPIPLYYPARQTLEASMAIARSHGLAEEQVVFACQNPSAINRGVFHNDVISVANESVFLVHEEAFLEQKALYEQLHKKTNFNLDILEISTKDISLDEAVDSYLFNSQLLSVPGQSTMILIAPIECENSPAAKEVIDQLIANPQNPIAQVHYLDLRQSMLNGGGPACLRLRVPLNEKEFQAMHSGILVNHERLNQLEHWVKRHYRSQLDSNDLADPQLVDESLNALDELSQLLNLGSIYPFQQN